MKLSEELLFLESASELLSAHLHSLRDRPELDYARDEASTIAERITYIAMLANHGDIPECEFDEPSR